MTASSPVPRPLAPTDIRRTLLAYVEAIDAQFYDDAAELLDDLRVDLDKLARRVLGARSSTTTAAACTTGATESSAIARVSAVAAQRWQMSLAILELLRSRSELTFRDVLTAVRARFTASSSDVLNALTELEQAGALVWSVTPHGTRYRASDSTT